MKLRRWQAECIQQAFDKYCQEQVHFLCLATPGAGKTIMAARLAQRLFEYDLIDLVICFSPSIIVANDFRIELEKQTGKRLTGLLGSQGCSLTYQGMLSLSDDFWALFYQYRVFVIFDEIHHCAGHRIENTNAWGEKIISRIQGQAAYTLALTGTPWRSDNIPIVLSHYQIDSDKIHCDYQYGLAEAIKENVCRVPRLVVIDNENILLKQRDSSECYRSFAELLAQSECSYQQLVESEALMFYLLREANQKLDALRLIFPDAGGLIVAASVAHARQLQNILSIALGEESVIATYVEDSPLSVIHDFKHSYKKWIVSVGMISEGTNIPRLRVCCHLTRVKTELYFRQVLGRILRANGNIGEEGYLFMPAEPTLIEYAHRVAEDIPASNVVRFDVMPEENNDGMQREMITSGGSPLLPGMTMKLEDPSLICGIGKLSLPDSTSLLAKTYETTLNIFGRFKHEVFGLNGVEQ